MSMHTNQGRPRRTARSRQLYEARTLPDDAYEAAAVPEVYDYGNAGLGDEGYTPNDPAYPYASGDPAESLVDDYTPNDPADETVYPITSASADDTLYGYTPNEPVDAPAYAKPSNASTDMPGYVYTPGATADAPVYSAPYPDSEAEPPVPVTLPKREDLNANLSAYYRRPTGGGVTEAEGDEDGYAYAPPAKLDFYQPAGDAWQDDAGQQDDVHGAMNIYRPREVSWDRTERLRMLESAQQSSYQVEEEQEAPPRRRRKRHPVRNAIITVCVLAIVGGSAYIFREQLSNVAEQLLGGQETGAPSAAITTPAPARGYDAASPITISSQTSGAISQISGTLEMEPAIVTDTSIVTRNLRADGAYDFYLFTAREGKLLAYFEGLPVNGISPMTDGGFYMSQEPYLINDAGTALITIDDIEQMVGESLRLHAMTNGWAVISNEDGTLNNYIDLNGQLLSRLWFAKAYPMTGSATVAYVDTGNIMDTEERYALYLVDAEGNADRWRNVPDMTDVVASACGMAYMKSGELYDLEKPDAPLLTTDGVTIYMDCDAMVVRDSETGKYGLFVHGDQHYDFSYDSIEPVQSDITWERRAYRGDNGTITLCAVTGANYPQPLSHYFLLSKDGTEEYVALSTTSACPVVLD